MDTPSRLVSVPFRGSCSEMASHSQLLRADLEVSVPFRGSCSEIPESRPFVGL